MKIKISEVYVKEKSEIENLILNFTKKGEILIEGNRNSIRTFNLNGQKINIKSFKVPNLVNKIAYRFFRKSKAERSYNYAEHLISRNIGTPFPIAYAEKKNTLTFGESYYLSEQLPYDLTYRELVTQPDFPEHEQILSAFTRFTFDLHEKQIHFLDHSPGNTLIQRNNGDYKFFLVDLNRMDFKSLNFEERMKNFSRLTPKKEMVEIMASEYARLINKPHEEVFQKMWYFTEEFQKKFRRKQAFKRKIKVWNR
ncbi:lipopolysaccharide kinase InaA family protein [soil metagenome]